MPRGENWLDDDDYPPVGLLRRIVHQRTDCIFCFGIGTLYPTQFETRTCPNGCHWSKKRNEIYAGVSHPQVLCAHASPGTKTQAAWVDAGVYSLIWRLWEGGAQTWVSCQGDETGGAYVSLVDPKPRVVAACRDIVNNVGIIVDESVTGEGVRFGWQWRRIVHD